MGLAVTSGKVLTTALVVWGRVVFARGCGSSDDVSSETERFAGRLHADLKFNSMEDILNRGLHDYLTEFLEQVYELGNRVSRDFLLPLAA